ncbi:MAG: amino acid-binding protein [Candidatus Thermoplasmatota archaeon]|nr:amino acid-binding protein [Candidatus Thermoplasmatota archaeon]
MWRKIYALFKKFPAQQKVVELLLTYGLRVENNTLFCGKIELSYSKVARAVGVDRRAVVSTVEAVWKNKDLRKIFLMLQPTCHLKEVAPQMNWGVVEIIPVDASMPGILASVSSIIAKAKISIRQAIVDDYKLSKEPRLFIVTEKPLSGNILSKIRTSKGVKGVVAY